MDNLHAYPNTAGYQKGSSTSKEAAESINSKAGTMRNKILGSLDSQGLTIDQVAVLLDCQTGTASARMRELELQGFVLKSPLVRKTRMNKNAKIYFLKKDFKMNKEKTAEDKDHKRFIHNEIIQSLAMLGTPQALSKEIIIAIINEKLPYLKIKY